MTFRTMNYTITQSHLNHLSAAGGEPRRVARINLLTHSTSVFSFVRSVLKQLTPCCVSNAFRERVILHHPRNVQILEHDQAKSVDKITAELVREVAPTRLYPFVNTRRNLLACSAS